MLSNSFLHAVTMIAGIAWIGSANASPTQLKLDEFAVSWQGNGKMRVWSDEEGRPLIQCECQGDVRVANEEVTAQAKKLTFDSSKQTLLLEGDVMLEVHDADEQPAFGKIRAERVMLHQVDKQVLIEVMGAKLQGTVRLGGRSR